MCVCVCVGCGILVVLYWVWCFGCGMFADVCWPLCVGCGVFRTGRGTVVVAHSCMSYISLHSKVNVFYFGTHVSHKPLLQGEYSSNA